MRSISTSSSSATALLLAWQRGEASALDRLVPLVHNELHRLARRYMRRERPNHTLQATALVNEAYVRLIEGKQVPWQNAPIFSPWRPE
jgi:DNA-directed RNA polymerase specialized sigma24 family protein